MASRLKARAPEEVKPGRIQGVLAGGPGSGKTWLALSFPSCYYIDTEGGADLARYQARLKASGGAYFGREQGSNDPSAVLEEIQSLTTEKHPYKTLVLDSYSKLSGTIVGNEQERLGKKDAFGASKKPAIAWARRLMTWLDRVDMNVWLVCHEQALWEGAGEERKEVGKTADIWEKFLYELHLSLQIKAIGKGIREATVTKSRLEGFPLHDRFYLEKNGQDIGYQEFIARYAASAIEAAVVPVILATAEQCAEIRRLLDIVKVSEDEQEKWFSKAGVLSLEEFTLEQASKVIEFINKKLPAVAAVVGGK